MADSRTPAWGAVRSVRSFQEQRQDTIGGRTPAYIQEGSRTVNPYFEGGARTVNPYADGGRSSYGGGNVSFFFFWKITFPMNLMMLTGCRKLQRMFLHRCSFYGSVSFRVVDANVLFTAGIRVHARRMELVMRGTPAPRLLAMVAEMAGVPRHPHTPEGIAGAPRQEARTIGQGVVALATKHKLLAQTSLHLLRAP
jgi:hypothetical protein